MRNILVPQHDIDRQMPQGKPGEQSCVRVYREIEDALECAPKRAEQRFGNAQDVPVNSTFGQRDSESVPAKPLVRK